jgi:hypothetical protein
MTIDERLEALAHSAELIASTHLKTEKEIKRLARYVRTIVVDHEQPLAALPRRRRGVGRKKTLRLNLNCPNPAYETAKN